MNNLNNSKENPTYIPSSYFQLVRRPVLLRLNVFGTNPVSNLSLEIPYEMSFPYLMSGPF